MMSAADVAFWILQCIGLAALWWTFDCWWHELIRPKRGKRH